MHRSAADHRRPSGSARPSVGQGWVSLTPGPPARRSLAGDLYPRIALGVGCAVAVALYALLAKTGASGLALGWAPALAAGFVAGALWPLTLGAALWAAILWTLGGLPGA